MNKLIFAARTREALKSYAQLNNLNPNNYVLVEIPEALRQNKVVKSLAQNITNPDVKYVMVHKSCVTVTHNGKPALNVTALSENSYASSLNKPESEKIGDKTVGKGGTLKSMVADIYKSNLPDQFKMRALGYVKSFVDYQKQQSTKATVAAMVEDIETSNLGKREKVAALKSLASVFTPKPVSAKSVLKSFLADVNESNLPLNLKNFLFSVIKSYANRSEKISESDEFVSVNKSAKAKSKKTKTMDGAGMNPMPSASYSMHDKKSETKSLGSLGSSVFEKRDLVEENKQLLKSLGSLSEDEGLFTNVQLARRYARLFNEKIASPSQRAEVASPSVKDVQRFGKRVKARINMV